MSGKKLDWWNDYLVVVDTVLEKNKTTATSEKRESKRRKKNRVFPFYKLLVFVTSLVTYPSDVTAHVVIHHRSVAVDVFMFAGFSFFWFIGLLVCWF